MECCQLLGYAYHLKASWSVNRWRVGILGRCTKEEEEELSLASSLVVDCFIKKRSEIAVKTRTLTKKAVESQKHKINAYPNRPSSTVAWNWEGIFIKAARANSACLLLKSTFLDIISVKLTNWIYKAGFISVNRCVEVVKVKKKCEISILHGSSSWKPENYQKLELGCYHQNSSSCPKARLRLRPRLLTRGTHCKYASV